MANGRVITGFSKPYVAKYAATGGTITYSNAMPLARGVDVSVEPSNSDGTTFYADNNTAENDPGKFSGATVTLTVDGLKPEAEKMIMGLPEAETDGFVAYDDRQKTPHVGIGFIIRYQSAGVESYVPFILAKASFNIPSISAATETEEKAYQTQELTASVVRADDANRTWKYIGREFTTEAEAESALKTKLGVSA